MIHNWWKKDEEREKNISNLPVFYLIFFYCYFLFRVSFFFALKCASSLLLAAQHVYWRQFFTLRSSWSRISTRDSSRKKKRKKKKDSLSLGYFSLHFNWLVVVILEKEERRVMKWNGANLFLFFFSFIFTP